MTNPTLAQLFTSPTASPKFIPRLAVSIEATDKSGKSHWSLYTPPDPICLVVANDNNYVYTKALSEGRKIPYYLDLVYADPNPAIMSAAQVEKQAAEELKQWRLTWHKFKAAMKALEKDKTVRTVVWDTATEIWNLAELAYFGKLRGNARIDVRTELNADFTKVFWDLYKARPELNMVLIHKQKKQYAPVIDPGGQPVLDKKGEPLREWNGKYERAGYSGMGYLVDMSLVAGWDGQKKNFYTTIDEGKATRYGGHLSGKRWDGEDSGFANLALETFPETEATPEIWGL